MNIYGQEHLLAATAANGGMIKFLLNASGIAFFSVQQQHREMKFPGLSYEDDYRGNALAGTFQNGRADIRFHQAFTDEKVKLLWQQCGQKLPALGSSKAQAFYQGREL